MTETIYSSPRSSDRATTVQHGTQKTPKVKLWLKSYRLFLVTVILPTALCGLYLSGFAADQYVSEARFVVRSASQTETPSILGVMLGSSGSSLANSEAYSVADYLDSHDAVSALENEIDLIALYRRPEADPLFRLWWAHPTQERVLDYYRRMVSITFDTQSNIAILRVNAFRRADSELIAERLLELGEKRVNDFSARAEEDTVQVAQDEVSNAEKRVAATETALTAYRIEQQALDPSKSAAMLLQIVGGLQTQLAQAQAQLNASSGFLSPQSPEYEALTQRIDAIEKQIGTETSAMTGDGGKNLAPVLAQYEHLVLEQGFAEREYTTALASLETARVDARKQHLFVARVVQPNLPDQSTYPRRVFTTFTVFVTLLIAYGIGWLLVAGTREHVA